MRKLLLGLVGIALVVGVYTAWPLYSLYATYQAYQSDDATELDARVDFASLRSSLEPQLQAQVEARAGANASPMAVNMMKMGVQAMLGGLSAEGVLRTKGDGSALRQLMPEGDGERRRSWRDLEWFFFTSPTRFEIAGESASLALRLDGATWRVYEVTLPPPPPAPERPAPAPPEKVENIEDLGLQPLEGLEDLE